ncbi:signal peptidase II [Croceivirga sp. JEA036]|uniref:signal peptidase II n=1 Tax=Croceivirga sp. JEA036 TaxID=2721162 RepID=UPI001439C8B9|nr:signal peptidase II [Croceivirga sp. JEA036]NJB35820.1 signal peptidase II [Croceivirga sp. JEA036]
MRTKSIVILLLILVNFGCDQISKELVRKKVEDNAYIPLVKDNFILTKVENTGAALGFGANFSPILKNVLLNFLPLVVLLILLVRIFKKQNLPNWNLVAFAFLIGGGLGNLIDRFLYGSVTDFFHLKIGFLRTGIFNMADVSVTLGAICLLISVMQQQKKTSSKNLA